MDAEDENRNVHFEDAVKRRIPSIARRRLGRRKPDYTLFCDEVPIAIVEAEKESVRKLRDAMEQARDYAGRIGEVPFLIACNGRNVKSGHFNIAFGVCKNTERMQGA